MSLGISIINYRTADLTKKCVKSILDKDWQTKINIWVLDNGSGDNSVIELKKACPDINIIESHKNLGFAGGHNLLLREIKDEYILILNSDTEVLSGSLDKMVEFLKESNCGVLSCKLVGFDGRLQPNSGDFPFGSSLFNWLFNLEIFGFFEPNFHRNEPKYYEDSHEVDWVSGGCMLVSREVFEKIGFFNDDYFMYFEDVEFCFRAKKSGFKVLLYPEVSCMHLSGGSLDKPEFRQWSGELLNMLKFYRKNFGFGSMVLLRSLIYIAMSLRLLMYLLLGKIKVANTYAKVIASL